MKNPKKNSAPVCTVERHATLSRGSDFLLNFLEKLMYLRRLKIIFWIFFSWNASSSIPRGGGSLPFGSRPIRTRDSSDFVRAVSVPFYPQLFMTIQMYFFITLSYFGLKYYFFWQSSCNILYFWPVVLRVRKKFRIAHSSATSSAALWNVVGSSQTTPFSDRHWIVALILLLDELFKILSIIWSSAWSLFWETLIIF